ncbi:Holliday junction resolvase-like protein [Candidatus Uzinura diaspidicola str. ASNER]|uniref:Putative pre-16S rRNA nuclease n=1 Tax=Candidatus Uzinura diaspidicola str. ASNER TaxID=1133592 RepID=L7VKC7_9FLAO|nr:Holliday junction resolvase-like protein [Candidatus Uzinura diaspidicola str. ASNER]
MNYRILSIDYGSKRTGLAVTDQLQMIAYGLPTIKTNNLMRFLSYYIYEENIQKVILGEPKNCKNQPSLIEKEIQYFISKFCIFFPEIYLDRIDERFTSKLAKKTLFGLKKRYRTNKLILDKISATLILQSYLGRSRKV